VGEPTANLILSDRRAEAIAVALSSNFDVSPENLVTQGYGEQYLKVPTEEAERENRRVTVRRITPLVAQSGLTVQQ
jgi:outer membrane protein OmpA-like peptidoglycan-associated protein